MVEIVIYFKNMFFVYYIKCLLIKIIENKCIVLLYILNVY